MDFVSEIIGCNLKYDYKPSKAEAMKLVEQIEDVVVCAKHCLDSKDCRHGWVYHAGNRKVGRMILYYIILYYIILQCYILTERSEMDQADDWMIGDAPCGLIRTTEETCKNFK